jgi:hypothetical protein
VKETFLNCLVCQQPFLAKTRKAKSCAGRQCMGFMAVFRETYVFDYIMLNSRWSGRGSGLESLEEMMQKAIKQLVDGDEEPLAALLIGLLSQLGNNT